MKNKKMIVLLVVTIILIFIICFTIMFERKNNNSVLLNNEEKIKILVEKHTTHTGMPGPNGESKWGTSKFIVSNGYVYEYEYDEYDKKTTYPREDNIEELSKKLISKAKKSKIKLSDEDLKLVKEYIKNIENKTEEIKEIKESETTKDSISLIPGNAVIADDVVNESFTMYNYKDNTKIQIKKQKDGQIYYESLSINKLVEIVNKYI